jgi:DNA-damage-inducible protein J
MNKRSISSFAGINKYMNSHAFLLTIVFACNTIGLQTYTEAVLIMAQNALIQIRVDNKLKQEADELFSDLGFDTPTAIRIFLNHAIKQRGLPFKVGHAVPNSETISAMCEAERIGRDQNVKSYTDVDIMMRELLEDV